MNFSYWWFVLGLLFWIGILLPVYSMTYPKVHYKDQDYVRAIVGEAANQTKDTMICVGHALRNRGTLKGVYGYNAFHIWNESDATFYKASVAWDIAKAEKYDPVHGCKNFGTLRDLRKLRITVAKAQCGDMYFY